METPLHPVAQLAAQECLATLAQGGKAHARTLLIFAHPDDETIGMGSLLPRLTSAGVIIASDGAPADNRDGARLGLSRNAYAILREQELHSALAHSGFQPERLFLLGMTDGALIRHLDTLVDRLVAAIQRSDCEIIFTHAYEGGHPDHDALALAVHLACRRCAAAPDIIEIPFYHAGPRGWVLQSFAQDGPPAYRIRLNEDEWRRKCAMLDAYQSQRDLLLAFRQPFETLRITAQYDFRDLPNNGRLLYPNVAPSLDPQDWLECARASLRAFA